MADLIKKTVSALPVNSFPVRLTASVLSIIIIIVVFTILSLYQSKHQYEKRTIIFAENLALVLEQNIQQIVDKTDKALLAIADEINRQKAFGRIDKRTINIFIANQKERLLVADSLRMANAQGMVSYGTAVESAPKTNIADRNHFTAPRNNPDPLLFISKPVVTRIDKKWALPVSRRINGPDGSFAGVVYANVELKTFIDMFSQLNIGPNGAIVLSDQEFKIVTSYPELGGIGTTIGTKPYVSQIFQMIHAGQKTGTVRAIDTADNIERIYSFRRVSPYPLYVVVARATSEYLSDWQKEAVKVGSMVICLLMIILFISWKMYLSWRRERQAQEELYVLNKDLEKRVAERTDEIADINEQLRAELAKRKCIEEALQISSEYTRSLIEASLDPLVTISPNGKITDLNKATEISTGYSREELIGSNFIDYFTDSEQARAGYQEVFQEGQVRDYALDLKHRDGIIMPVLYNASVYRNKTGQVIGVFAAARDITDRKLAEDKIKSLLSEKELLLREVHHRIKNNMSVITGMLMLQAETLKEPSAIAALKDAQGRVRSMMVLYDKLYRSANFRTISAKEYLTSLIDEIVRNFPSRSLITVETHIDDCILEAKTLSPMGIIINELLTNAMKYAFTDREKGIIRVSLSIKDKHATLIIQDNGSGIPESIDTGNSTGFGLQLVSMLTEQLEGTMRMEREEGTRFVMEFEV
jgi:PAS domain S-box-containing protein